MFPAPLWDPEVQFAQKRPDKCGVLFLLFSPQNNACFPTSSSDTQGDRLLSLFSLRYLSCVLSIEATSQGALGDCEGYVHLTKGHPRTQSNSAVLG